MGQDPRAVLGLPLDATRDEAQRAFRRLAKQTHPDAGGDASAFRAVAGAWAELGPLLPHGRRPPPPSPHVAAYRNPVTRIVWTEIR
ncbi:MAG TPA: J domain-containing protein, partial [Acidimicrobiia bacterium]|nr:J domain-containing protein [Acidimicrobiia bacterium]